MTRIIFVDDEPNVLMGLKDALRKQRRIWDMTFVEGGQQALDYLSQNSVDIIVSDMRMPQMDGAVLLETVRDLYPHMTRLVLSGHSERDQLLRASAVAHQYLSKPCNGQILRDSLASLVSARERSPGRSVQEMVGRLDGLTSVGAMHQELMQFTAGGSSPKEALAILLNQDSGLASRVAELAGQAFPELELPKESNAKIVDALGFERVRAIALVTTIVVDLVQGDRSDELNCDRWLQHSLRCARIAEEQISDSEFKGISFAAGLLHDIGRVVHSLNEPKTYDEIWNLKSSATSDICTSEIDALGSHHGQTGCFLLESWGLNPILAQVSLHHHLSELLLQSALSEQKTVLDITRAVQQADRMVGCPSCADDAVTDLPSKSAQELINSWTERESPLVEA